MYKRKFLRRPRRKIIRRRRGLGKKSVPLRFKRYVKRVLHANIENKNRLLYAANQSIEIANRNTCTLPMICPVNQGVGNNQRIGNAIKIKKGIFKVVVNLLPYNATTNPYVQPIWVKMFFVRDLKNSNQLSVMDVNSYLSIFKGNGVALPFQNTPVDLSLPINDEAFRLVGTRTFKLGVTSITNQITASAWYDNSPFAKQITFNWGKYCKKLIKFNDDSGYSINDNLYCVIQPVYGPGEDGSGKLPIEIHYVNEMQYEDA